MKSNFNELFDERLEGYKKASGIDIEAELDEMMPQYRYVGRVTKKDLTRIELRSKYTTALNSHQIYSYEKGHFVFIENANEEQLRYFKDKAEKDAKSAERRKANAEERLHQISLAWDENGNFIGFHIPEAMNL